MRSSIPETKLQDLVVEKRIHWMNKSGNDDGISLRPCTYADLGQIHVIERESFPEDPYPTIVFINLLMLAREGFIVACSGDSVVGYTIGTGIGGEGMIQSMAVTPSFRRRGVGARLVGSVIEHLSRKHRRISLLVDVSNETAIHLYRKFGFSETGRVIKAYYPNGNDAIEMGIGYLGMSIGCPIGLCRVTDLLGH